MNQPNDTAGGSTWAALPRLGLTVEEVPDAGVMLRQIDLASVAANAPLRMSCFTVEPGCSTSEDKHAVHEVWLVAQGQADVHYDGRWHRVPAGQAVYFAPWRVHCSRNSGPGILLVYSVWWS